MRLDNKQKEALLKAIEEIYCSIAGEFATELSNLKGIRIDSVSFRLYRNDKSVL